MDYSESESFEHQKMKKEITKLARCYGWKVEGFEISLGKLRPDILLKKGKTRVAIECQCSLISLEEFVIRNSNYEAFGLPVFWVFGNKFLEGAQSFYEWTRKRTNFSYWTPDDYYEEYTYEIQKISLLEKTVFEDYDGVIWYFDGTHFYYAFWKSRYKAKFLGWFNVRAVSFRVVSEYLEKFHSHYVTGGVALVLKKLSKPQFLSVEEVPQGSVVTVVEEPYIVPAEQTKWGKERGRVVVRLGNGEERSWTMNNTTWDALIEAFGAEPSVWLGKKIQIDIQQMNVRGEVKQVIFGKPYVEPPKQVGL